MRLRAILLACASASLSAACSATSREHATVAAPPAANGCLDDPHAIDAPDIYDDQRFVLLGRSSRDRVLFVVHAVLRHDRIRIISARKASPAQREAYERETPR